MSAASLFSDQELADAAFDLLASSTLDRYARMAEQAALHSRIADELRRNPHIIPQLLDAVKQRWVALRRCSQRDVPEVEVALLVSLLAQTAAPQVDDLLKDLSLVDCGPVAWISALARRLLRERTSNTERSLWPVPPETIRYETRNSAAVRYRLTIQLPLSIKCDETCASQQDTALAAA